MRSPHLQTKVTIFRMTGALVLFVFTITLGLPESHGQGRSEAAAASTLEILRKTPDLLKGRAAALRNRLNRKRPYLGIVNTRLSKARGEGDEKVRTHKLSRFSYQSFLISSHIASEEAKLREVEALTALLPQLGGAQALALIQKELDTSVQTRIQTAERLLREAEQYRSSITESGFKQQFERLVASIQADRNRLKEGR